MNVIELQMTGRLRGGYYTIAEAARILRMGTKQPTIRNWLTGNGSEAGPVIARQYPNSTNELGFYDLIEIRFIDYFRRQDVSLQSIRKAAQAARRELEARHPFAMSNVCFVTDRRKIFKLTAEETGDKRLMEIVSGQHAMYDVFENFLAKGIEFAPDGLAGRWYPEPTKYPKILISPKKAHGHPIIDPAGVPTRTIFDLWRAENQDKAAVADWFEIGKSDVEQAVEYELDLAA